MGESELRVTVEGSSETRKGQGRPRRVVQGGRPELSDPWSDGHDGVHHPRDPRQGLTDVVGVYDGKILDEGDTEGPGGRETFLPPRCHRLHDFSTVP